MQKTNMSKSELSNGTNTSDFLKSWAKVTLRSFHWRDFNESLFLKSPRELGNDDEKEKIYALSSETKITDFNSKIDYFISHSWEDKRALKCSAISSFVSDSKGGYCSRPSPTFWFDKVCIDQKNTDNSLLVLPLNIASSKQVLVLMSSSYMKRLWYI